MNFEREESLKSIISGLHKQTCIDFNTDLLAIAVYTDFDAGIYLKR